MMILRKKTLVLSFLVVLLVVVAVINHNFNKEVASDKNLTFVEDDSKEAEEVAEPEGELAMDSENEGSVEIEEGVETSGEKLATASFFIQSRLDRDKNRSFYIETLNGIVADEKIDKEVREMAQKEMISLIKRSETERIIENLIKAKGFKDALVIMSDEYVNVIINSEKLTQAQVAQIKDIVSRETKAGLDKIKIMEKQ
jgi:stage III sporulation protein AH